MVVNVPRGVRGAGRPLFFEGTDRSLSRRPTNSTIQSMSDRLPGYEEAAGLVAQFAEGVRAAVPPTERVALASAAGRVLAQPICADRDQPPFARSTRDGFACRAGEVSTHAWLPVAGAIRAGEPPAGPLPPGAVWEIMTGAPVPAGADAVAMIEHVKLIGGKIRFLPPRKLSERENVVAQGAQARKGDLLISIGARLGSAQIAVAAECGYAVLDVFVRPRVAILTTGDELVAVDATPGPGQIRNSNAPMLAALVAAEGGEPWILPTAADSATSLDDALADAAKADLILLSGGVSAGKFDLVEPALERLGARFHFTGVRIQPGKPMVFGELPADQSRAKAGVRARCFLGLPGNPVSSYVTFLLFGAPVLLALTGSLEPRPRFGVARVVDQTQVHGKSGLTRFLPAFWKPGAADGQIAEVALVPWQGSGDLAALARSNCFLVIPEDAESLKPGTIARILLQ